MPLVSSSVENSARFTPLPATCFSDAETAAFPFMPAAIPVASRSSSLGFSASRCSALNPVTVAMVSMTYSRFIVLFSS